MTTLSVLCDENVDRDVISYPESGGHHGEHVVDTLSPGADDETDVAPYARENDLAILTKDTDFLSMDERSHTLEYCSSTTIGSHRTRSVRSSPK